MSEHPTHVSGHNIKKIKKDITDPSSWVLKVYEYLKALNLRLESVVKSLFIHRPRILDLR